MLKPLVDREQKDRRWLATYMRWVQACLRHRVLTMVGATVFFFASIAMIPLLPSGFIPPDDNVQTQVRVELPPGTKLAQTMEMAERVRQRLLGIDHIHDVYTAVGAGSAGADPFSGNFVESRKATLTLQLSPRGERPKKQVIEAQIRAALEDLPGARFGVGLGGSNDK